VVPPFAWSEGWATFYSLSTMSRLSGNAASVYWDIQGGTSFWIDMEAAASSGPLAHPVFANGQQQSLDENWVSHMIWELWDGADVAESGSTNDGTALGSAAVMAAVTSDRFLNHDRAYAGADFVDFVDAVVCAQPAIQATVVGTVTGTLEFPYDNAPVCNAPQAPVRMRLHATELDRLRTQIVVTIEILGGLPAPPVLSVDVPAGARLERGAAREALRGTLPPGTTVRREIVVRRSGQPVRVTFDATASGAGVHATASWPPPAARPSTITAMTPIAPARIRGLVIDRAVDLTRP